jgi:hypothetical protein
METTQTEVPHKLAQLAKCAHSGCVCTVESGETYCSDCCASMAAGDQAAADDECNCGHPECMAAAHASPAPLVGRESS